jgi:glucose/arabinose dehydrogenase
MDIVFTSNERVLVNERPGRMRVITGGKLQDEPIKRSEVSSGSEAGLMGLTLDPEYASNKLFM